MCNLFGIIRTNAVFRAVGACPLHISLPQPDESGNVYILQQSGNVNLFFGYSVLQLFKSNDLILYIHNILMFYNMTSLPHCPPYLGATWRPASSAGKTLRQKV